MRTNHGVRQPSHQEIAALHASLTGDVLRDRLGRGLSNEERFEMCQDKQR